MISSCFPTDFFASAEAVLESPVASFNCASITDNGTGDYSVTRTNNMSSVDTYYVVDGQFVNSQNTNGVDYANSTASLVRY